MIFLYGYKNNIVVIGVIIWYNNNSGRGVHTLGVLYPLTIFILRMVSYMTTNERICAIATVLEEMTNSIKANGNDVFVRNAVNNAYKALIEVSNHSTSGNKFIVNCVMYELNLVRFNIGTRKNSTYLDRMNVMSRMLMKLCENGVDCCGIEKMFRERKEKYYPRKAV